MGNKGLFCSILYAFRITFFTSFFISLISLSIGSDISGLDPRDEFLKEGVKSSIPLGEIHHGGPSIDGIPALNDPERLNAQEAMSILDADDIVMGVSLQGQAVAYPIRLLNWHEIVNDTVGKKKISVTFCPLCGTGIVFDRQLGKQTLDFGVSGLLYESDMLMYDIQTHSLWTQILGKAVVGPKTGRTLRRIPVLHTTWSEWLTENPRTQVVSFKTGYRRDYKRSPYMGYARTGKRYFPTSGSDDRLEPKDMVFGVEWKGQSVAMLLDELKVKKQMRTQLGSDKIILLYRHGPRAYLEIEKKEIPGTLAFWFAWSTFYPDTLLLRGNR